MKFINPKSNTPKFRQIIQSVKDALLDGRLKKGDALPSINELCGRCKISRDTVVKAYDALRDENIILSVYGKGFFIQSGELKNPKKVFLFMDDMNMYKEKLYKSLRGFLGEGYIIKLFFHHDNADVFKSVIDTEFEKHNFAVIIPLTDERQNRKVLKKLPGKKIILADRDVKGLNLSCVYQDFYNGSLKALEAASDKLRKYEKFNLVTGEEQSSIIYEIKRAFEDFCRNHKIVHCSGTEFYVEKNEVYWAISDASLVEIIKESRAKGLALGSNIGIMSYNDTLFKELLCGGISLVSTDFDFMGEKIAELILSASKELVKIVVPTIMIQRNSL